MKHETAFELLHSFLGEPKVATYKAPHAPRPTPPRLHYPRQPQYIFSKAHDGMIPRRRPFKGHRP